MFSGICKFRILRAVLIFLGLGSCGPVLVGQENIIVDIVPHGNRSVPRDVILAHVFTHKGDIYPTEQRCCLLHVGIFEQYLPMLGRTDYSRSR